MDEKISLSLNPFRITYIHQDGLITGSAISLINLLSGFKKGQIEATIIMAKDGPVREMFEKAGARVIIHFFYTYWTFPGPRWYWPSNFLMQLALLKDRSLERVIKGTNPQILHINDKASLAAGVAMRKSGVPIIQHLRSNYLKTYSVLNKALSKNAINGYADLIIAISEDEVDGFEGHRDLHVVYNSISQETSTRALENISSVKNEFGLTDEFVISYVGLLNENKGAWIYLQVCGKLKENFPHIKFRFFLVAPIPEKNLSEMSNQGTMHPLEIAMGICREQSIEKETILTGFRKDALSIVASSALLMVMNKQGVLGRQPFEAMSVGVPPVAVSGHSRKSNIIENGYNGILVSDYHPNTIAAAAGQLISDPSLRNYLSNNGLKTAREKFNPAVNSQRVFELYNSLING